MILFFFNISIIIFYIINFDLPKGSYLLTLLWIILFISIFSQFSFKLKSFHKKIVNLQFSISVTIFLFLLLEIAYVVNPNIIPTDIRMWVDKNKYNYSEVTEKLDVLPYVKFKPNTLLRTNFYRGSASQFSYEWNSDQYGFKNSKEISKKKNFKALAIGDSFTEGMGVDTDKTYPSLLSKEGILTYNLGVQGYSLSQSLGTLKLYENNFNYEYIILNYIKGTFPREKVIYNFAQSKENTNEKIRFTGGIANFESNDRHPEERYIAYYVTSGIWLYTKNIRIALKSLFREKVEVSNPIFKLFSNTFYNIENNKSSINFEELSIVEKPILEINKFALENNKKFIVIIHDFKPITYYERATGKKLPNYIFEELNYLEKFLKKNNITNINLSKILIDYVNELEEDQLKENLPYLEIDGHLNEIGYGLLSQKLKKIIN